MPHEGHLRLDSDYESDPDPTGHAYGAFDDMSHESDTEILNETESPLPSKPMLYEEAGESIGDVKGFVTTLRSVATITITLAQMVYQEVSRGGMVSYTLYK